METAKDLIKAGRVTKVGKLTSMSEDYYPNGEPFSLFLAPTEESDVLVGDVIIVDAMLPNTDSKYVEVPVVMGDWSPVVFLALKSGTLDLDKVNVYVAPLMNITL